MSGESKKLIKKTFTSILDTRKRSDTLRKDLSFNGHFGQTSVDDSYC